MMIRETTFTKARKRLAALMDQVISTREPVLIRRRGHEPVALVPGAELAGWFETAYLSRSPENVRRLLEAGDRVAEGKSEAFSVDGVRERLGLEGE